MLILQILSLEPAHGYGIAQRLEQISRSVVQVNQGSLYPALQFVVTQRTREIGIRPALGATRSATVWLVLRDALVMIAAGITIALSCVWALGRLVESQLYGINRQIPATFAMATLILCSATLGRGAHSRSPRLGGEPY